jgi:hypothetical protein
MIKHENSSHFYTKDGVPAYDADLRKARKEGFLPSVTTILKLLAQPGLEVWKQNNLLQSALTLPKIDGETLDMYAKRVAIDSQEQSLKARENGISIHDFAQCCIENKEFKGIIKEETKKLIENWIYKNIKSGVCEQVIYNKLYAGRVDFHGYLSTGEYALIDFKTQGTKAKVTYYIEWLYQLAAYRYDVWNISKVINPPICMSVVISTTENLIESKTYQEKDITNAKEIFDLLVQLFYKIKKLERNES